MSVASTEPIGIRINPIYALIYVDKCTLVELSGNWGWESGFTHKVLDRSRERSSRSEMRFCTVHAEPHRTAQRCGSGV